MLVPSEHSSILVFDSGLGGLTVLRDIQNLMPNLQCHYLFDNQAFPYGELDSQVLIQRVIQLLVPAVEVLEPDILVIACNTASTLVLEPLRQAFDIPIVGVVPAIKPAAELSKTKHIGLLATPATIKRDYTHQLIQDFAVDCKVSVLGSSELVRLAEKKALKLQLEPKQEELYLEDIRSIIKNWCLLDDLDVVVLGCTHFPWVADELSRLMPNTRFVDSGSAIAKRVKSLITESDKSRGHLGNNSCDEQVLAEKGTCISSATIKETHVDHIMRQFGLTYIGAWSSS